MKPIICQATDCNCKASWRVVDRYVQQKQNHIFFYYYCDEHYKNEQKRLLTVGHKKKFYKLTA